MKPQAVKDQVMGLLKRTKSTTAMFANAHVSYNTTWLNSEHYYVVEESLAELPNITAEDVRQFKKQMLSQMHIETFVHGNLHKEDALKMTDMIETILKRRVLPRPHWPIIRSLVIPPGSNYVYKKTLKDPANVNHCVEVCLYVGDKVDRLVRAKTKLFDQMSDEPAFDQLRNKEQLGYVVFSGVRGFTTIYGFNFIIQSERTYLESRIEAFLNLFSNNLDSMSESEFKGHKRSLINELLEKFENLDEESESHWHQIVSGYYDFEQVQKDAEHIRALTSEVNNLAPVGPLDYLPTLTMFRLLKAEHWRLNGALFIFLVR
ncbi:a-pheromone processing metallopeptidase ste23 [Colletotrichum truncatum]|uniref:A-pheromone processing metallopeptidase ste23 n=1 Tax=Colletotrichum truncatum TaxID=5467 RepID=A0ACC3YC58_COLTU